MKLSQTRYKPLSKEGKNRMKRVYPRDKQSRGNSGACCSSHLFSSFCSIIHSLLRFVLCCAFFFYPVYPYSCFFWGSLISSPAWCMHHRIETFAWRQYTLQETRFLVFHPLIYYFSALLLCVIRFAHMLFWMFVCSTAASDHALKSFMYVGNSPSLFRYIFSLLFMFIMCLMF